MHSSQSPSPQLGKSSFSSATRRDILWNVVQPGDPYDIRRSMIARLPGDSQHFMGDNLQIVCLLQSAQIQRLCEFLDDYKFRYRQIERRQLDRHSYEIQIKQLTQRVVDQNGFRSQNLKLKQFIKKLQIQIQQLKSNRYNIDNNLRANYQSALAQIQTLMSENNFFKSQKQRFIIQINNYSARIQALESTKQRQMKELFSKYVDQNRNSIQNETRSIKTRYQSEINRLEFEIKRLKQFNEAKNQQINELNSKNRNLIIKIQQLQSKKDKTDPAYLAQIQNRFALMGQQIQRLNLRVKQSTAKIDESSRNELYWKNKYSRLQEDYKSLQIRFSEINEKYFSISSQYERVKSQPNDQVHRLQQQIRRLNAQIKHLQEQRSGDSQKYITLQRRYSELQFKFSTISVIEKQNAELKSNLGNTNDLKRRLAEYQTKVALFSQQIERLTALSKSSGVQKKGFDELKNDFDQFKRKSIQKQRSITQKYESQMQRKILQYESRLAKYAQDAGSQFQVRLQGINRQVQRLNTYLKEKTQQSEQNKRRIRQLESSINQKYEIQVKRNYSVYESTIKQLRVHNQQLDRKIREFQNINRKIAQYQNKIALFSQQIERLNFTVKSKNDQIQNLRKSHLQSQTRAPTTANISNIQTSRRISILQQTQINLNRENQDLRRRLQQIVQLNRRVQEYQLRIRTITQQNDRVNNILKQKLEIINRNQANYRNVINELEMLRKNKLEIESTYTQRIQLQKMENSRKFINYQQSLTSIQRQYEQLRNKMMNLGNDNSRKTNQYQNKIVLLTQQIQRLNQIFKIKINDYQNAIKGLRNQLQFARKQNRQLQINITQKYQLQTSRKIGVYEQNMSGLTRQLQDLRRRVLEYENSLRKKNEQVLQIENKYRFITQEYQSFKIQTNSSFQLNMNKLTRQYQDLKRRIPQYQNRIALISQQNQRLNMLLRNGQIQQQNLRKALNELKIQITQKYELQTSRKINNYEQNLGLLNKQKEDLRRKLIQYENNIVNLKRQLQEKNRKIAQWQNKFRQTIQQNQMLSNKFRQLQITITQKYQVEASRKITNYEQNIQNQLRQIQNLKMRISQYENRRVNYQNEINRLNMLIRTNSQEHQRAMQRLKQGQKSQIQKYEVQVTRKISIYEQNITNLNIQIEDFQRRFMNADQITKNQSMELQQLRRRLKQYGDIQRTVAQYENQFALIRQQLERVNINLKNKIEESNNLQNRLAVVTRQNQSIAILKRQNDQLRRRISQLQNKLVLMTQQIQRLNNNLRIKVEELGQSQLRGRNWQQQIENSRRKLLETQKSNSLRMESQLTRTVSLYEQNITTINRQFQSFKGEANRRIAEYETKFALVSQQLQRATQALRMRSEQYNQLDLKFKNSIQQLERLQRALRELELSSNKRFDSQKTTIISTYQQNITVISRQFDDFKNQSNRRFGDYQNKIVMLTRELERVNGNLQKKVQDYNALDKAAKQLQQQVQFLNKQIMENQQKFNQIFQMQLMKKVSSYEQNFSNYKIQIQTYDRKNKQLTRLLAQNQNKIALMTQQIERLNHVLKTKADEAKHYQSEMQRYVMQLDKLKISLTQLQSGQESQIKKLQSSYTLVSKQYENSKKHLIEYEQSIRKLYSQFQRLQIIINQLKVQRQTLFDKNHGLIKQIERLTTENKDQQTQLYQLRIKFSDQVSLQKRINEHMALMVVLFAQIQTLRQRVKDKQKQVQQVRRSSLAPLKA